MIHTAVPRFLLLASLSLPLAAQGGPTHELKVAAKKGASAWLAHVIKQEQLMDMGGQQMEMGNTITYTVQVKVADVDAKGVLSVEATIARIAGAVTVPMMGDVEFDSAKPSAGGGDGGEDDMGMPNLDAIGDAMTALAGKTFKAKVSPAGEASDIEGIAAALDEARKKAGRMGAQMLGGALNDGTIERLIAGSFGNLPSKPVAVGESWERQEDGKSSRMKVSNKLSFKLAKLDDSTIEIAGSGTIEKPAEEPAKGEGEGDESPEAAQAREMMAQMKMKNGKIEGLQKISRQDGFTVESSSTMSMDIEMPSPMGGGEMQMSMKVVTTVKRTTEEAAKPAPAKAETPAKTGGK